MPQIPQDTNECNVITIFPMGVECVVINPSNLTASDGAASLSITGGTPPYTILWDNGNIGPAINNLSVGDYGATVIDYYGDFTVQTTCVLTGDTNCSYGFNVENYLTPNVPNCFYTLTITGGTSIGPYTIYYNVVSPTTIAEIYSSGNPATGLTLLSMEIGVNVSIPCSSNIVILYNELCDTIQTASLNPIIPINDFCLTYFRSQQKQFEGNGYDINGNPTWTDNSGCDVFWDVITNQWKLSCLWEGDQLYSTDPITSNPPLNGWYSVGPNSQFYTPVANLGLCQSSQTLSLTTNVNQPDCECDGSITLIAEGGVPPYQYSKDNGLNYVNSPIFVDLCPGIYSMIVKDDNGDVVNSSVTINPLTTPTTYNVSLTTTSNITTNTTLIYEVDYVTTLNVTPQLPVGVTITVDLEHLGLFENTGKPDYSTLLRTIQLKKNNSVIAISNTSTTNYTQSPPPQCPLDSQFTGTTNDWNSITFTNSDSVIIETTSRVIRQTQGDACSYGIDTNTYSISRATINGCECCDVLIETKIPVTTTTTTSSFGSCVVNVGYNFNFLTICSEPEVTPITMYYLGECDLCLATSIDASFVLSMSVNDVVQVKYQNKTMPFQKQSAGTIAVSVGSCLSCLI
jgi:hypothetical protein